MKGQFMGEIIGQSYQNWTPGSKVFIVAHPGSGKTTFVLNELLPYAILMGREILFLSNRSTLHKQLLHQVCRLLDISSEYYTNETYAEFPGITLATYQSIAEKLPADSSYGNIPFYHYVVFDEAHFFDEDSDFNPKIQRLIKWKQRIQCAVEIYITATPDNLLVTEGFWSMDWSLSYQSDTLVVKERAPHDIIRSMKGEHELLFYYTMPSVTPAIRVFVYDDITDVVNMINRDLSGNKWLLFQSCKETARKIAAKDIAKSTTVITAEDKECSSMKQIVDNQRFNEDVLVTTKVLDNGVNLHDPSIKNILIETTSRTEFIQMLGRRRIENDEEVILNLYLPRYSVNYFWHKLHRHVIPMLELTELPQHVLITKLMASSEDYKRICSLFDEADGQLVLNPTARRRLIEKKKQYQLWIERLLVDRNAFVQEQLSWLGLDTTIPVTFMTDERLKARKEEIVQMLESYESLELDKHNQAEIRSRLKSLLKELAPERFSHSNRMPGVVVINLCLKELRIPFEIESISGKRKGETTKWLIKKI